MTLRERQAPLKTQYKENPESALLTLHGEATLGPDITCEVRMKTATIIAGLHPATGGSGKEICSGDMLLESLAACAGVTMNAVATALEIELRSATVRASGMIDFRGTLGVDRNAPVGFKNIHLEFDLDTDAPHEKIETLLKLTERYCVVFQTLNQQPEMSVSYQQIDSFGKV